MRRWASFQGFLKIQRTLPTQAAARSWLGNAQGFGADPIEAFAQLQQGPRRPPGAPGADGPPRARWPLSLFGVGWWRARSLSAAGRPGGQNRGAPERSAGRWRHGERTEGEIQARARPRMGKGRTSAALRMKSRRFKASKTAVWPITSLRRNASRLPSATGCSTAAYKSAGAQRLMKRLPSRRYLPTNAAAG